MLTQYAELDIMESMSAKRNKVDLAEQLRATFEQSGMSKFELARRSGVSYSGVHRFISGERDITLDTASRLAEVLGVEFHQVRRTRK